MSEPTRSSSGERQHYHRRRAEQERNSAEQSVSPAVRRIHLELADIHFAAIESAARNEPR